MILVGLFVWPLILADIGAGAVTDSGLRVSPHAHNFGAVNRLGGHVHTGFVVHNQGDTPIKIRRIWTS
ncbi:MAG: hypothetical protein ACRERE_42735 [Candidatus Entotheonellia bacterium]